MEPRESLSRSGETELRLHPVSGFNRLRFISRGASLRTRWFDFLLGSCPCMGKCTFWQPFAIITWSPFGRSPEEVHLCQPNKYPVPTGLSLGYQAFPRL